LRPDIQVDLPERTLLGDVTVRHPVAKSWRNVSASDRGVAGVGDRVATKKHNKYDDLARDLDVAFSPIVVYTYGGFHESTMSFLKSLFRAVDPATSLIPAVEWRETLLSAIAIAVQRWTAKVMITAAQQQRAMTLAGRLASLVATQLSQRRGRSVPASHRHGSPVSSASSAAPGARAMRLAAQLLGLPAPDGDARRDPTDARLPTVHSAVNSVHTGLASLPAAATAGLPSSAPTPTDAVRDWVPSSLDADGDVELPPAPAGRSRAAPYNDAIMDNAEGGRFALGEAMLVH
jgi:hypothetical protein